MGENAEGIFETGGVLNIRYRQEHLAELFLCNWREKMGNFLTLF